MHQPAAGGAVALADPRVRQQPLRDEVPQGAERGEPQELPVATRREAGLVHLHAQHHLEAQLQPGELVGEDQLQEGLAQAQVFVG